LREIYVTALKVFNGDGDLSIERGTEKKTDWTQSSYRMTEVKQMHYEMTVCRFFLEMILIILYERTLILIKIIV
jgi:hypothetical protein